MCGSADVLDLFSTCVTPGIWELFGAMAMFGQQLIIWKTDGKSAFHQIPVKPRPFVVPSAALGRFVVLIADRPRFDK